MIIVFFNDICILNTNLFYFKICRALNAGVENPSNPKRDGGKGKRDCSET